MSRILIMLGIVLAIVAVLIHFGVSFSWLGNLPGDVHYKKGSINFFLPITTSIVISFFLTIVVSCCLYRRS